jgi:PBP1b-binding outer membrane lipoprotein LpoB
MQKTLLSIAIMAFILSSCNNGKKEAHATEHSTKEQVEAVSHENHETHQANAVINNNWMNDIQMDNGSKWLANIETTEGVNDMLKLISESKTETVKDYLSFANKLNNRKNTVVKECTMTGPSHDNLHVFLHPLIEKIDVLLKTKTIGEGAETLKSITDNLNAYKTYFK